METLELKARIRKESGKGPARRMRAEGMIPAIFYGAGTESLSLSITGEDLFKLMKQRKENAFIKLMIDQDGTEIEKLSMIKELQTRPATKDVFHADFYEIRMDHKLTMDIPIHVKGSPIGVTMGGELHILKRELRLSGLPAIIPQFVEIDISGLNIGDTVKVGDIQIADGLEVIDGQEVAVATVSATRVEAAPEAAAAEGEGAAEPEVISKGKAEEA